MTQTATPWKRWHVWSIAIVGLVICALAALPLVYALSQPRIEGVFSTKANKANKDVSAVHFETRSGQALDAVALVPAQPSCGVQSFVLIARDVGVHVELLNPAFQAHGKDRQRVVMCLLASPAVTVRGRNGQGVVQTLPLDVKARKLGDLNADFWVAWVIGTLSVLSAGWVWAMRPRDAATGLFLLNGLMFMTSFFVQAVDTVPNLGADPQLFVVVYWAGYLANQVFYLSLMALFLLYPVRLVPMKWLWLMPAIIGLYVMAMVVAGAQTSLVNMSFSLIALLAIIAFAVWQWRKTARLPRERAALMWMALSVIVGATLWVCVMLAAYSVGHVEIMGGTYISLLFFPFYLGLALGVARFFLVELQDWTFRILYLTMAALLFITMDAALVTTLGLTSGAALGIAVVVVAFGYLPLRDIVWRRFAGRREIAQSEIFAAVMEIAFAPTPNLRRDRWQALIKRVFEPLEITPLPADVEARIEDAGLRLSVPAVAGSPALSLGLAQSGKGLFTPTQLALVRQLVSLVKTATGGRDAYERGASEERRRLAQDLHDDVGARLLSGLNTADAATRPVLQGALADIRTIASGMMGSEAPMDRVMADIRYECVRRLEAASIEIDWPPWPDDAALVLVDYRLQKALASALREIVSNIIKHSGAKTVTALVTINDEDIIAQINDDGCGLSVSAVDGEATGQGLAGLMRRTAEAGGQAWFGNAANGGTQVRLRLPLTNTALPRGTP